MTFEKWKLLTAQLRSFHAGVKLPRRHSDISQYAKDPLKLILIPVTTEKSFVYFKYSLEFLNKSSRVIRYEAKITEKAAKVWQSMQDSNKGYNKKIVSAVNKLLDQNPWTENSLKTIPSESYILKRLDDESKIMTLKEYSRAKASTPQKPLIPKPIHVYYPGSILTESSIRQELERVWINGQKYHKKYGLLSLLGIPLTFPLILIPIVPNVPGFYLAYRAYCNFKAYVGAKHLESLFKNKDQKLEFIDLREYAALMEATCKTKSDRETLLFSSSDIDQITELLDIREISSDLKKALRQENAEINNET